MNKEIEKYIEKQKFPQKEICRKLRKIIFKTFPDIEEEMKWGVPSFGDSCYYIVSLKDSVNLGFSLKGLLKQDQKFFEGSGKIMKHIKICSLKDVDEKKIVKLLKLVKNK